MELRLAGIISESVVDGPGIRMVVFFQGCKHNCPECHNPDTHDFAGGYLKSVDSIIDELKKPSLVGGITLSGGEPLEQPAGALELASRCKEIGKNVMLYSGYTWEQITKKAETDKNIAELLTKLDILIDGPFIKEQKDLNLAFRGSLNQRVIDVQKTLLSGEIVEKHL